MTETARSRALALIGALTHERRAIHTGEHPIHAGHMLPEADVIVLVADDDPGAMLFRYTAYGESSGDTWHESADAARDQAFEEYGDALGDWENVPDEVSDAHHYAVKYAADRLNSRGDW